MKTTEPKPSAKLAIKKILVPVDFSPTADVAVSKAISLAGLLNAQIFILHVVPYNGYYVPVIPEILATLPPISNIEAVAIERMEELKKKISQNSGITFETDSVSGDIHAEIIKYSNEKKIDLIVMGTQGASGFNEFFIGSNAQRIVTRSDVPVLTLQQKTGEGGFKRILIPIDNELHSREKVNLAMIFAELSGAEIHIIGLPFSDDEQEVAQIKTKVRSVEKIVESDNLSFKTTIIQGNNLAETAMEYATENKCDLIVINTGHESRTTGIFLGAFAQQIVNHAQVPVLSFKHSEGYFSIDTPGFGIG